MKSVCAALFYQVEVKPYVLDDQICDECQGLHSAGKFAPFFCANVMCLQYYCEHCWSLIHSSPNREFHKPLVKEGADRPRALPFRWCWAARSPSTNGRIFNLRIAWNSVILDWWTSFWLFVLSVSDNCKFYCNQSVFNIIILNFWSALPDVLYIRLLVSAASVTSQVLR